MYGGGDESTVTDVSENDLSISGGTFKGIIGGMSPTGEVRGNTITFSGGTVADGITGGVTFFAYDRSTGAGDVTDNIVNITGGSVGYVSGGEVAYVYDNSDVPDLTQSYFATGGNVTDNIVNISGGIVSGGVYGGTSLAGKANGNIINISGGTISGDVIGGEVLYRTSESAAMNNVINVSGTPNLGSAYFYGGMIAGNPNPTGNVLNIRSAGITMGGIDFDSFEQVKFWIPASVQRGGNILTMNGGVNRTDLQKIAIDIDVASRLTEKDTINLVVNGSSLATSADFLEDGSYDMQITRGVTTVYDANLAVSADGGITATIGTPTPSSNPVPDPENKSGFSIIERHVPDPFSEMMTDDAFEADSDDLGNIGTASMVNAFSAFLHTGGGRIKTKTGGGGYTTTKNGNFDLGFARSLEYQSSKLYIAPVFEYVNGSYDSKLTDGIYGDGKLKYIAGGFIARRVNNGGFYYEGSLRGGRVKNEFASNDFVRNDVKTHVTYDMSSPVFTGHLRLGHFNRLNKNNLLDVFGVYSYARQNGMSTNLSTGEHVDFSSVDSHSLRLGYRLTTRTSSISRIYTGLAYQYDRNSNATVTGFDYSKTSDGVSGSSGMLELGWQIKPQKSNPWILDIGAVGWTGHHQGFSAMAKVQKSF